jgi:RNA-directed DNA polymerase
MIAKSTAIKDRGGKSGGRASEHSYGFRPKRSAHQAVTWAQEMIAASHDVVVDIDLEKFFDRVNHDILMGLVAKRVADKRILTLIRGFLTAGAGGWAGRCDGRRYAARRAALAAPVEPDA